MSWAEKRLLRRLRERDENAFRELLREHSPRLLALCSRLLGNRAEAEDAVQEVFVIVFKTIEQFREESKLSTWLYRVATNHCRNRMKYLALRRSSDLEGDAANQESAANSGSLFQGPTATVAPDKQASANQIGQLLEQALASLDEEFRIVVLLRDVEELSYEEICVITELPEGTVKSRLHRGRLILRKKMARYLGEKEEP